MSIRIYQFVQYPPYNPGMNTHRVGDDSFAIVFVLVSLSLLFVAALVGYSLKDCSKAVKDYRSRVEQVFDKKKSELDADKNIDRSSPQIIYALQVLESVRNEIKTLKLVP